MYIRFVRELLVYGKIRAKVLVFANNLSILRKVLKAPKLELVVFLARGIMIF